MLVNWKVRYTEKIPNDLQAPDYYTKNEKYWFFRYLPEDIEVDVIDISSNKLIENIERKLHFYIVQTIKAIRRMKNYDVVISHGMPSGILMALYRRIFGKKKEKHIIFDIGAFNSAKEKGVILKLNQFASKSIDGIIYHESEQIAYYKKCFPWLVEKSKFIPFGTDVTYFDRDIDEIKNKEKNKEDYIISIGYNLRDNETLIEAYKKSNINCSLKIIGATEKYRREGNVQFFPPIKKRELNKEIQNAKFCVLPLEYREFSFGQMTLLHQMYYEKIVITANVPSMKDYIIDGKTGILYKSKDIEDLKNKIEYTFNNYENLKDIEKLAKKSVETEYNEEKMAKRVEEFINKIVDVNNIEVEK